ncbi:MAG: endolytic transglycosylase MltG [Pseudomonadales bacterium]
MTGKTALPGTLAILLLLAVIVVAFAGRQLHNYWFEEFSLPASNSLFQVASGTSLAQVINDMSARKLLGDSRVAKIALRLFQPGITVKAGEYRLPERASRAGLFEIFASGVSVQHSVTLVEGITARDALLEINRALSALGAASNASAVNPGAASNGNAEAGGIPVDIQLKALLSSRALELMHETANPEGWFFPDTYYFVRGETAEDILRRAHRRMLAVLDEEWPLRQADLPYARPYQALIMASIVEKETGAVEEREQIAGVFLRRLQKGMRLQTDPTVIYGMREIYKGNLTRAHLKRDTPYNTYTRSGLPPTPIALPGRGAIHAALHPADGDALYFVAKGDGSHQFSKTLEEHQRAVRKYQVLQRRSDYRSSPPASADKPVLKSGAG